MANPLSKMSVQELASIDEAHVTLDFEHLVMTDEEFWVWLKENVDDHSIYQYELGDDNLLQVDIIAEMYR